MSALPTSTVKSKLENSNTNVFTRSTSVSTSLLFQSMNADVSTRSIPTIMSQAVHTDVAIPSASAPSPLELQHKYAFVPSTSTSLPLQSVLSSDIFENHALQSLHNASKILTSKSNPRNPGFDSVPKTPSVKPDRPLANRHPATVVSSRTFPWIRKHVWETVITTGRTISSTQSTLFSTTEPRNTVMISLQTTVPANNPVTNTKLLSIDVTAITPTTPVIYVSGKDIPSTSISNKEIPKMKVSHKEIPKTDILRSEIPISRKEVSKMNVLRTEIPKTPMLRSEIPILRHKISKTKISLSPQVPDYRIESSPTERGSAGQRVSVDKLPTFRHNLLAMLKKYNFARSAKPRVAKSPIENVMPSQGGSLRSQCQHTGCVNGVCQQVMSGLFKCRCYAGFQLSTTTNICVPHKYGISSCSLDSTCINGRCVLRGGVSVCQCNPGYKYIAWACVDINECMDESACRDGFCYNYQGGYNCNCYPGYYLHRHRIGRQCKKKGNLFLGSVGWLWLLFMGDVL
ncbi:uncharacterized protein LOC121380472 [Gigantopelta aegis]|uniref:uncharacterized protein LOC121380472 n=1 Tax=Gigantopelta aegis TaxID=1735272 RepID=UPI001B88DC4E|nr:uncharacterized protein LOC121380472 [Gigantopelta aegis]